MKLRLFFILLFLGGVGVSIAYSLSFLSNHYDLMATIDSRFVLLIIGSIALQMAAHVMRAYKSRYLIDTIREAKTSTLFKGLSIGYLFNSLLPLRLGEFIRAYYVGDALAISKTAVFMSIVIERLVDGIILGVSFIGAGLAVKSMSHDGFTIMTRLGLGLLALSVILALLINIIRSENKMLLRAIHSVSGIFNTGLSNRFRFMVWSGIYGTRLMLSSRRALLRYTMVSCVMWAVYFCSTALVVFAFFRNLSANSAWYTIQSSYAGVSTPAGPGYISTFHAIVTNLLERIGLATPDGFAIFIWLVITAPISLVGLFVLIRQQLNQHHDASHQEALINKLYREKDVSREFSHFLDAYFNGEEINRVLTQAELDGKFKLVRSFKGGSNAHTMLVWQKDQLAVKKITLPQYADKLQAQAQWLSDRSHLPHLPRVIDEETTPHYYSFDLAFNENFATFFEFIHSHSDADNKRVLDSVLHFMKQSIYQPVPAADGTKNLEKYIEGKVTGKVADTAAINSEIGQLLTYDKIIINGKAYANLPQVIKKIRKHRQAMADLGNYQESPIHGDLTVDNLIVSDSSDFLVLDPNNENQVSAPVVDYAKLYQSLHSGYEFLIQLEQCEIKQNAINYEESKSQKYASLFKFIDKKLEADLPADEYRSIIFHEGVHYCRMLTYRANINPETLPVFYATAVKLFNDYLGHYA